MPLPFSKTAFMIAPAHLCWRISSEQSMIKWGIDFKYFPASPVRSIAANVQGFLPCCSSFAVAHLLIFFPPFSLAPIRPPIYLNTLLVWLKDFQFLLSGSHKLLL